MFDNNARKQTSEMAVGAQYRHIFSGEWIAIHGVCMELNTYLKVIIQKLAKLFV